MLRFDPAICFSHLNTERGHDDDNNNNNNNTADNNNNRSC